MNAKHHFKYTYEGGCEDFSPVDITFELPGDISLSQMLYNFQSYLKAVGFVFDGELEIVDHTIDVMKDQDNIDEIYGCMADWDNENPHVSIDSLFKKDCGCESISSPLETKVIKGKASLRADELKEMNERWNKLSMEEKSNILDQSLKMSDLEYEATKEVVKNNWVHGMCNPPSPDWRKK